MLKPHGRTREQADRVSSSGGARRAMARPASGVARGVLPMAALSMTRETDDCPRTSKRVQKFLFELRPGPTQPHWLQPYAAQEKLYFTRKCLNAKRENTAVYCRQTNRTRRITIRLCQIMMWFGETVSTIINHNSWFCRCTSPEWTVKQDIIIIEFEVARRLRGGLRLCHDTHW